MAWLRDLPPTARHHRPRWQVRYRDDSGRERSAGIYSTKQAAGAVKRRIERRGAVRADHQRLPVAAWDDLRLTQRFDDGAVTGPGRLRVVRALSDPANFGRGQVKGPKTEAGRRTIALDQDTVDALVAHRDLVGGEG